MSSGPRAWWLPLTSRIVLIFVLQAAALLSIVGVVFHHRVRESLEAASVSELLTRAMEKETALNTWLDQRLADLDQFSHDEDLQERVASLIEAAPGSPAWRAAHALVLKELSPHMTGALAGFTEIFVMEPDGGTIVASTLASQEGKKKAGHPYFDNGRTGTSIQSPYRSVNVIGPAVTAAVPLRLPNGRLLAVLAARLDYAAVNAIAVRRSGLRETAEAFLINRAGLLVTQPRFIRKPAVLSQAIHTEAAQRCVAGASGVSLAPDYRGVSTFSVFRWIPGHELCLIASIDQAEALAPADAFARSVLLVSVLALLATAGLAASLARTITRPLRALQDSVGQFAEGRDSGGYLLHSDDEVAQLALAFAQMQTRVALRSAELAESNVALLAENAEHKRTQEVLRESETKFKQMAESITDVFWVTSADLHTMHYVSPAIEEIWGLSVASLYAKPLLWLEAIVPEDRVRVGAIFGGLVEHPSVATEYRIMRPDGTIRWIHDRGFQVLDAEGKPYRFTGIASDITDRKLAEVQVNMQSAMSRVLAESSTVEEAAHRLLQVVSEYAGWEVGSVWTVDQRSNVLRCGEVWNRVDCPVTEFRKASLGMTMARGEGLPGRVWASGGPAWITDLAKDGNFPRAGAALASGLHAGFAFPIVVGSKLSGVLEFYAREARDPGTDLLLTFAMLGSQFGQFVQNRQLEGQLFQSQRLETVGKLAGGIAHEFNSILTAIIGQSEMLLSDLPTGDPLARNAVEIRRAADRAARLTGQLLAFGRKQVLRPDVLDLNRVVSGMEGMLYHLMGGDV
ncbi:MAG: PAS domain-containing protein, partial [Gemmatimonadota bacterium]